MHTSSIFGSRIAHGVVALVIAFSAIVFATSTPAHAGTTQDEADFVELINNLRVSKGLAPLQVDGELTAASRSWAQTMSTQDKLYHAPDISAGVTSNWKALGENVGVSTSHDTASLFEAFVQSPLHYKNLIDPRFTHVGVGVVYAPSGKMWTTHRFMQLGQTTQTTSPPTIQAPATTAAPATAPPQTAAPVTQPPATTTPQTQATAVPTTQKPIATQKPTTTAATVKETATSTEKPEDTKKDPEESKNIIYFEPKYSQTELRAKVLLEAGS